VVRAREEEEERGREGERGGRKESEKERKKVSKQERRREQRTGGLNRNQHNHPRIQPPTPPAFIGVVSNN
jgi:hypothetical protein